MLSACCLVASPWGLQFVVVYQALTGGKEEPPRVGFALCYAAEVINTSTYNLYAVSDGADSSVFCMGPTSASGAVRPPSSCCWAAGLLHSVVVWILKYTLWPFVYWNTLCRRCCVEVYTLCRRFCVEVHSVVFISKYTLSPLLCWSEYTLSPFLYWSTLCRRCCVEVYALCRRFCAEVHSLAAVVLKCIHFVAVFVLKYAQLPFLYWNTLCRRCCVEVHCHHCCVEVHSVAAVVLKYTLSPLLCWSTLCRRCCVEVHSVTAVVLKYTLSPLLCWSTLCHRCCVEVHCHRCCVEVHSVTAVVLKYTLSPLLCWSTLCHRCCVEMRQALWPVSCSFSQTCLSDLSPVPSPRPVSQTCLQFLLPDLSLWPVSCFFSTRQAGSFQYVALNNGCIRDSN